jgi:hypothetical protein
MLLECGPEPLGKEFEVAGESGNFYRKILPVHCSAWDRGFFFQVVLIELELRDYSEANAAKPTFCLPAAYPGKTKTIYDLGGKRREYPVFNLHLVVNRSVYPPWNGKQDKLEWQNNLTGRTKGVAHELLYGAQYAHHFDWSKQTMTREVVVPSVEEENQLLCPDEEIERRLQSTEKTYGIQFPTPKEFVANYATKAVQSYYRVWLEQFAVDRQTCHERSVEYLGLGLRRRNNPRRVRTTLKECMSAHGIRQLTTGDFRKHAASRTRFFADYVASLKEKGAGFPDDRSACWYTALHVEQARKIEV